MSESKPTRLAKAAIYFNVGREEIIEYLESKGFEIDANPNAKIDENMFNVLNEKFRTEHDERAESNQLGKSKTVEDETTYKEEVIEPSIELAAVEVKPILTNSDEKVIEQQKTHAKEENLVEKIEKPEIKLAGPKIIDKIDIDSLGTGKKKKTAKEKNTEDQTNATVSAVENEIKKPEKEKEDVEKTVEPIVDSPEENIIELTTLESDQSKIENNQEAVEETNQIDESTKTSKDDEPKVEHIETKYQTLKGATVVGSVDLTQIISDNDKKKGGDKGKKRTRIKDQSTNTDKTRVTFDNTTKEKFKKTKKENTSKPKTEQQPNVLSQKELDESIKRTEARIGLGGMSKGHRQKIRKKKREELHEKQRANEKEVNDKLLKITEFITVSDLASLMNISPTQIITFCFGMGLVVSINQRLDAEIIELITSEFDYEVEFISLEDSSAVEEDIDDEADLEPRAPIVTIMGHVDHGKTSLLDYIRKSNVVNKEAGGITQHIGAYDVLVPKHNRKITFIDTPGHEAFTAMRARGAKITDVAVIVIAADDKVMPQTKEAISHAQSANVPMIFALNKIDKEGANPDGVRAQLSEMNLLVESWGGKYQEQEISAKKGIGIEMLLEKILLEADMLDLKANPKKLAVGTVIEASLDKGRGYVATVLVLGGTLHVGDFVVAGACYGKIKAMTDHMGNKLTEVLPGQPAQILGLNGAPSAGETFREYEDEHEAKQIAYKRSQIEREQGIRTKKHITLDEIGRRLALGTFKELNIIIKGDMDGSVQALTDSLTKLSTDEIQVNVLHKAVGAISESDVLLATASDAIIIGFQVRPTAQAKQLAEKESIDIRHYSVIYQAIDEIKAAMEGLLEPTFEEKITGNLEILEVFKIPKVGSIAGCMVVEGKVYRNSKIRIIRDGIVVHTGELDSLKRFKDDVKEVVHGQDCGLNIKNFNEIAIGDVIEAFEEVEIKRTL